MRKKAFSGQITLETAMVMPIILLIVVSLIYICFYIHDVVILKSYGYSAAVEYKDQDIKVFEREVKAKINNAPVIIIKPYIRVEKGNGKYDVYISMKGLSNLNIINNIVNRTDEKKISVERSISAEMMNACRAICDKISK